MNAPTAESAADPADGLECYEVGGAVRDALLGLPVQDRDWVVIGATPEQMLELGFTPVGRDFPVFLHPRTHEEYALARTERKSGPGYRGFVVHCAPDVRLEDDLLRRDLTINAMARSRDGRIIDPHGGRSDLAARVFRHVSAAFVEDPVRILRVARFCARFSDFTIAPATLALMGAMVERGEVDALVPERVWQELARGLMQAQAPRMLDALQACGAATRLMPDLALRWSEPARREALLRAATHEADLAVRWAVLLSGLTPEQALATSQALRAPQACADLARMLCRDLSELSTRWHTPQDALALLERCDAFRKPERFATLLAAAALVLPEQASMPLCWRRAADAAIAVMAGSVAQGVVEQPASSRAERIRTAIASARCAAIAATCPASRSTQA